MAGSNINGITGLPIWGGRNPTQVEGAVYCAPENQDIKGLETEYLAQVSKALENGVDGVLVKTIVDGRRNYVRDHHNQYRIGVSLSIDTIKTLNDGTLPDAHRGDSPYFYTLNPQKQTLSFGNIVLDLNDKSLSALKAKIQEITKKKSEENCSTEIHFIAQAETTPSSHEENMKKVDEQLDPSGYDTRRRLEILSGKAEKNSVIL